MYSRMLIFIVCILLVGAIISSTYSYYIFKIYISENVKRQELTNLEYDEKIAKSKLNITILEYERITYQANQQFKRNLLIGGLITLVVTMFLSIGIYARYSFKVADIHEMKIGGNSIPVLRSQLNQLNPQILTSLVSLEQMSSKVQDSEYVSTKYKELTELSLSVAQMNLKIPQQSTTQFPVFQTVSSHRNPYDLFLGVDEQNTPCISSFTKELRHVAILGTSGSGKTQFLTSQVLQLKYYGCEVVVLDPQHTLEGSLGQSLAQYGVKSIDPRLFEDFLKNRISRQICLREMGEVDISKPYVIVLDELPVLMKKHGKVLEERLEQITSETRKIGMYVITSSQHGTGKHLGSSAARDGATTKIAFAASPNDAENLFQNSRFVDIHSRLQRYQFLRVTSGIPEQVIQAVQLPESDGLQFRAAIEAKQQLALKGE